MDTDNHPFTERIPFTPYQLLDHHVLLLPNDLGFAYKKNKIIGVVRFNTPSNGQVRKFWADDAKTILLVNYWRPPKIRCPAINIVRLFPTPELAKQFLENTLRVYMESAIAKETIPNLQEMFRDDRCYLFPGTDVDSDYVKLQWHTTGTKHTVLLSHIARYAYTGDFLYCQNSDGQYVHQLFEQWFKPSRIDLSHRCHHRSCFNPHHLVFETHLKNSRRCRLGDEDCECDQFPPCVLGNEVVKFNYFWFNVDAPWPYGHAYEFGIHPETGRNSLFVLRRNEFQPGEPINGVPDSQYYVESNTNEA